MRSPRKTKFWMRYITNSIHFVFRYMYNLSLVRYQLMHQVEDILVELDARRDQMKPPGSKAHEVLLESMRLLQVTHVDQISPNIRVRCFDRLLRMSL